MKALIEAGCGPTVCSFDPLHISFACGSSRSFSAMAEAEEEHREAQSKEKAEHRQHKSFKQGRKQGKEYESSSSSSSEEEAEDEEEAEEDDDGDDGDNGDSSSKADAKGKQKKQKRRKEMKKKQHQKKQHQKKKHQKKKQNRVRINPCLVILNLLLACVGIGFIGVGLWMALNHGTNCVHFLQTFLIGSGLIMLAIAASGIAGAVFRLLWLLYLNFIVMLLLLLLIVGTTVFVLIITGHGISASFRAEHSSNGSAQGGRNPLSSWIRDRVNERIRACTQNGQICNFVQYSYSTGYYSRPRLSDLQRACCEAPEGCNSNNIVGNDTAMAIESDCIAWRQAGATTGFCSHCSLCRAAVAENVRHVWHTVAIFKVITLLILLPAYFITCCNFKQDDGNGYSGGDCRQGLDCCFNVL